MDHIVPFLPLARDQVEHIAERELSLIEQRDGACEALLCELKRQPSKAWPGVVTIVVMVRAPTDAHDRA